jgi:hypothetical protein
MGRRTRLYWLKQGHGELVEGSPQTIDRRKKGENMNNEQNKNNEQNNDTSDRREAYKPEVPVSRAQRRKTMASQNQKLHEVHSKYLAMVRSNQILLKFVGGIAQRFDIPR